MITADALIIWKNALLATAAKTALLAAVVQRVLDGVQRVTK